MLYLPMELQTCLLFTTLVVCGAEIRPAGWLDKVVAHWKKSFVADIEQLGPFNLDASIEPAPPGYQDSPDWDFDSVSRMLALLSMSQTGQPTLNSLQRMIAPTRRMMMDVPGLAVDYIPQSVNKNRMKLRSGMNDQRRTRYYRKRTGNNRMGTNIGMGMVDNRKGMAYDRTGMQSKIARKQMLEKRVRDRQLSDLQMSFRLFPSLKDQIPNDIYYDEELYDYAHAPPDYEYVTVGGDNEMTDKAEEAIVMLKNPVEARLPSSRISVKLLKEILQARAEAARVMPTKKTTEFSWKPIDMTTPYASDGGGVDKPDGGGYAPAADGDAPAPDGDAPAANGDAPAPDGDAPAPDGDAPAANGDAPAADGDAPAADGDAPAPDGDAPAPDGEAAPAEEPAEGRKMATKISSS